MNTAASNYHESSQFIHLRYEDTALVIFQQQQKVRQDEKRREQQQKHSAANNRPFFPAAATNEPLEFGRYGNRSVVAKEPSPVKTKTLSIDTPTKSLAVVLPSKPSTPIGSQPSVKSSTDQPDQYKRRRRRRRRKVVTSIESSV